MNVMAFLTYITVMSFTPGPNNLMCLYLGARLGMHGSIRFMIGSSIGLFVKSVICGLLNLVLAENIPAVVPYLKWIGFAYMLYLAYSVLTDSIRKKEDAEQSGEGSFASGIMLQVLNIKSWIVSLSIFSVYVIPYTASVGIILLSAFAFTFVAATASVIWCGCGTIIQGVYKKYRLPVNCILAAALAFSAWGAVK